MARVEWFAEDDTDEPVLEIFGTVGDGLEEAGEQMTPVAQSRAPKDTGNLASNIGYNESDWGDEDWTFEMRFGVDDSVEYAGIQEEKHRFIESTVNDMAQLIPGIIASTARKFGLL